ncbi:NAD(P)-dependent alcohol dehydrogenase [Microbispora sp. GKU 823]|uniref:NAD(P)-dependent alcohol dehydrogenase n=1 Tax=Microbispora sp. GKU 823 TaxID=1652100 RepID=UPI002118F9DD|nr:NAD(P)-dependent alcohol dehydrogenase [Microbispora sp. GKU 823]
MAGVVAAVGARVTRFQPGQEVYGTCESGSYAEYASARQSRLAPKPAGLTFEQAAAIPVSGMTALQAVRDVAQVRPGQRALVIGASGGVGSFAVQIAKAYGASVTGVCSAARAGLVRSLGADDVVDYAREEIDRDGARYDVVVDTAGNRPLSLLRRALTPRGTLVIVGGGHTAYRFTGGMGRTFRAPLLSMFVGQRLRPVVSRERAEHLEELARFVESGAVTPVIDRAYPLSEAPDAIRRLIEGHPAGKVVVTL